MPTTNHDDPMRAKIFTRSSRFALGVLRLFSLLSTSLGRTRTSVPTKTQAPRPPPRVPFGNAIPAPPRKAAKWRTDLDMDKGKLKRSRLPVGGAGTANSQGSLTETFVLLSSSVSAIVFIVWLALHLEGGARFGPPAAALPVVRSSWIWHSMLLAFRGI